MATKKNKKLEKLLRAMDKDAMKAEEELRDVLRAVGNALSNKLYRRLDNAVNFACFIRDDIATIQEELALLSE